jgi:hypothetical protein
VCPRGDHDQSLVWTGLGAGGCCSKSAARAIQDGRARLVNPADMQDALDRDARLPDDYRSQLRLLLDAHEARGVRQARALIVGVENALRLGGEFSDRLPAALSAVLLDAEEIEYPQTLR